MITIKEHIDLYHKRERTEEETKQLIEYNKYLLDRYPFLTPYNVFTGELSEDYDYTYTWLDDMPEGWQIAFGEQLLEELRNELLKFPYDPKDNWDKPSVCENDTWLNHYRIHQIKEKYGELRWYGAGIPGGHCRTFIDIGNVGTVKLGEDEKEECQVWNIINKYTDISRTTCIECGKPAVYISTGWICPWCEDCAQAYIDKENKWCEENDRDYRHSLEEDFVKVEEFYKKDEE